MGFPRVDLESYAPDDEALAIVPAVVARERQLLPLFEIEGTLTVAIGDPADVFALDAVGAQLGYVMDAVLADGPAVKQAVTQYFGEEPRAELEVVTETAFSIEAAEFEPFDEQVATADQLSVSAADFFELLPGAPDDAAIRSTRRQSRPSRESPRVRRRPSSRSWRPRPPRVPGHRSRRARRCRRAQGRRTRLRHPRAGGRAGCEPHPPASLQVRLLPGLPRQRSSGEDRERAALDAAAAHRRLQELREALERGRRAGPRSGGCTPTSRASRSCSPSRRYRRWPVSDWSSRSRTPSPQPRELGELGMADAECKALQAMVERGRGLLLVAAPVGGGRSTTYYALLQHAAQVGKTVYSVERSIEYEIPAVAQVLVNPGRAGGRGELLRGRHASGHRRDRDRLAAVGRGRPPGDRGGGARASS